MKTKIIAAFAMIVAGATTASAHFQLLYTPEVNLARAADVTMKMVFWHPLENGPMMDMGKPQAVYYRHKGKNVDLTEEVSEVSFHGPINDAVAFEVTTPVRRLGGLHLRDRTCSLSGGERGHLYTAVYKILSQSWWGSDGLDGASRAAS